jgi:hypothetical protein
MSSPVALRLMRMVEMGMLRRVEEPVDEAVVDLNKADRELQAAVALLDRTVDVEVPPAVVEPARPLLTPDPTSYFH